MKIDTQPNFFENYNDKTSSEMIKKAWELVAADFTKNQLKKIEKEGLSETKAKKYAEAILNNFKNEGVIKENDPSIFKYRFEIVDRLKIGIYGGIDPAPETPEDPTVHEDIGYTKA